MAASRVLIVAYYFPPIGGIGSIRLARFASMLPGHGWEPTVLAPRDTPHAPDPSLRFPEERVVRSRSLEVSRMGRTLTRTDADWEPRKTSIRARLRSAAHRYLFYPDAQIGWYPGAVAAGLRALRAQDHDVIYSSAYPMTAHLVARTLSHRTGLPWVAESRDPLADRMAPDHPYLRRAQRLERAIAREATVMVMPTPTWAAHYGALWGTEIAVLPNGHDGRLPEHHPPARPTLAHIGTYYPSQHDLTALWKALVRMREQRCDDVPRVMFVGHPSPELQRDVDAFGLGEIVETTGFLPHDEAMRRLMSASMLVASGITGDSAFTRGWIPAKVFDYIASGLPVLYLSDPGTDAARLMADQAGIRVVAPSDVDGAVAAIRTGLADGVHHRDIGHLGRAARTRALADILERARQLGPRSRQRTRDLPPRGASVW